ncbi:MAG: LD-carboxypeptidase [Candidatus Marsarchaeota archaeon]|nr:LD-carboxypeptidase [Candidatus Marsarchaeota archaeon]
MTIPKKLEPGDKIAVIAPSRSLSLISSETQQYAINSLRRLGLEVEIAKHAAEIDEFSSSSVKSRIEDLEWAFSSKNIEGILTVIGGFNSNEMLSYIDFGLIRKNPKPLCGFSDATILNNSIFAKAGLVTYYGPHFSTFGMLKGNEYTIEYFKKCLMSKEPYDIVQSKEWSDDSWYKDQENRKFLRNEGCRAINSGSAEGTVLGGNLCTFNLLQGTEYMPNLKDSILFLEDDDETTPANFARDLQSVIHQPGFEGVKGIVIGRFQLKTQMSDALLRKIIKTKKELDGIPIISNADFGHTTPIATFPIGGTAKIRADEDGVSITIKEH